MLFQLQLFATLVMTGVIWVVQLVVYPLFAQVGREAFLEYHRRYCDRITWIVAPVMLVELGSAVALWMLNQDSDPTDSYGLALLATIWISTALVQIPAHKKLERGYDAGWSRLLVLSNWVRTAAWTARAILLVGQV